MHWWFKQERFTSIQAIKVLQLLSHLTLPTEKIIPNAWNSSSHFSPFFQLSPTYIKPVTRLQRKKKKYRNFSRNITMMVTHLAVMQNPIAHSEKLIRKILNSKGYNGLILALYLFFFFLFIQNIHAFILCLTHRAAKKIRRN